MQISQAGRMIRWRGVRVPIQRVMLGEQPDEDERSWPTWLSKAEEICGGPQPRPSTPDGQDGVSDGRAPMQVTQGFHLHDCGVYGECPACASIDKGADYAAFAVHSMFTLWYQANIHDWCPRRCETFVTH